MRPMPIELMHDQVRAIYRALTGSDLDPADAVASGEEQASTEDLEDVTRRFADLDALARQIPAVMERVPPFSFEPPADLIDEGDALLVEVAVPGIEARDVTVERSEGAVVLSGVRRGEQVANGRTYLHAEIPRGPFERRFTVPPGVDVDSDAEVEVDRGLISIRLPKAKVWHAEGDGSE
jgi:HSP20 family protein